MDCRKILKDLLCGKTEYICYGSAQGSTDKAYYNRKTMGKIELVQDGTGNTDDDRKITDEIVSVQDGTRNADECDDFKTMDKIEAIQDSTNVTDDDCKITVKGKATTALTDKNQNTSDTFHCVSILPKMISRKI